MNECHLYVLHIYRVKKRNEGLNEQNYANVCD